MSDIMTVGLSSLTALKTALTTASDNIANANTPGYSRREVVFSESNNSNGVSISTINRIFDTGTNQYAQISNTNFWFNNIYSQQMQNFEPLLDDDTNSIGKYITDTLNALQQLNLDSASGQSRNAFLGRLNALTNQFQTVNDEINRQYTVVNQSLQSDVSQVNQLLTNLAGINNEFASSQNVDQSTLADNRDSIINQLSQYFNFTATTDANNITNISLNNGMLLVSGGQTTLLTTLTDPANPSDQIIGAVTSNGNIDISNLIQSGEMAGWVNFRANALQAAQLGLNRLSLAYAATLNAQNKLGIDANGNLGLDLFNDVNSSSMVLERVIPNTKNTGTSNMSVTIDDVAQLQLSNYQLSIGAANSYHLIRQSDNTIVSSGNISSTLPQSITVDGFTLTINSGTFNSGDQYIVSPTNGAIDNMDVAITSPNQLALGWPVIADPNTQNTGNGVITLTGITDTTNSSFATPGQLSPPITVQFLTATSYQLVNANNSSVIEGPITYNPSTGANIFPTPGNYDPGYRVSLTGVINAGDSFNIKYNNIGNSDNRNGLQMAQLYQQGILDGNSVSFNQEYNLVTNDISVKTNAAEIAYDSTNAINQQASQMRDEISGVSLEEEMINMSQFQEAYQASAQVIQAAKTMFESIISLTVG